MKGFGIVWNGPDRHVMPMVAAPGPMLVLPQKATRVHVARVDCWCAPKINRRIAHVVLHSDQAAEDPAAP